MADLMLALRDCLADPDFDVRLFHLDVNEFDR